MSENNPNNSSPKPYKYTFPAQLCDWCGKPAELANQSKTLVCDRCYIKLMSAGLSEEEIFGKKK